MKIGNISAGNAQMTIPKIERNTGTSGTSENIQTSGNQGFVILLEDMADISGDARSNADDLQNKLDEMRNRYQELRDGLKRARDLGEGMSRAWKEKILCLKIAMRIMSGDKVPIEDKRFLAEKDPELYRQAISLRREKKDPKEYDRLSEKDEKDDNHMERSLETGPVAPNVIETSTDVITTTTPHDS